MSFCASSGDRLLYGSTPVDNLFLQEFLPRASGDAVRVYLYGLWVGSCGDGKFDLPRMARALDMETGAVERAFAYWERQGLIVRVKDDPPEYEYQDVRAAFSSLGSEEKYYGLRDFNNKLQALFGTKRLLHPADFTKAAEWVEDLKLPENVVLTMVRAYVTKRGTGVTFKYLDKIALAWAKEGVNTAQAAEKYLARESAHYLLAEKVLRRFNLRRGPTEDELALARKWLEEYALSPESVLDACAETVKGMNPSFGYLDGILSRNQGASDLGASLRKETDARREVRELLRAMGATGAPTADQVAAYERYRTAGFEREAVLETAKMNARAGKNTFDALDRALARCAEANLFTLSDIDAYRKARKKAQDAAAPILAACGIDRAPTDAEAQIAQGLIEQYGGELALCGARRAVGARMPLRYLGALLANWKAAGIETPAQAEAEGAPAQAARQNEHAYIQHDYGDDDYRALFADFEAETRGDGKQP